MEITFAFATRDDCLDRMVPSDLRELVVARDHFKKKSDQYFYALDAEQKHVEMLEKERDQLKARVMELESNLEYAVDTLKDTDRFVAESVAVELEAALNRTRNNS